MPPRCWSCLLGAVLAPVVAQAASLGIEVRETAGIRRFQYPLALDVQLPEAVDRGASFRLTRAGKPVAVQFCPTEDGPRVSRGWLDFAVDLLPYETAVYVLECGGAGVAPARKSGLRLVTADEQFQIVNEKHIAWTVPRDLAGLLRSVKAGDLEYLQAGANSGLLLRDTSGREHTLGGPAIRGRVVRSGPLAVSLAFDGPLSDPALTDVRSSVTLTFPISKSWVEVNWQIEDPHGKVSAALARLQVNLDVPTRMSPTLVDFGATSLVYLSLMPGQQAQLQGDKALWRVLRGAAGHLEPYVQGAPPASASSPPEGWLHLMDRRCCAALAVAGFALGGEDRITVAADGPVELARSFRTKATPGRQFRFWLHCVPFPPQQTAATSPQSMQHPPIARAQPSSR